jgi:two-component system, NarL family, response regulator
MDLRMPGPGGAETTARLLAAHPGARVVILTTFETDEDVFRAFEAGAMAYALKADDVEILARIMHAAAAGKKTISPDIQARLDRRSELPELTRREMDVLNCLVIGKSNKETATHLQLSVDTVKGYLKSLFQKLQVLDRTQAVVVAAKVGLLKL